MNEIFDLVLYIALFAVQVALLIVGAKRPSVGTFVILYAGELSAIVGSIGMASRYNGLPGVGPIPGLNDFAAFVYSYCAAIAFSLLLLATIIVGIVLLVKHKKEK